MKIDRLMGIVMILLQKERVTAQDLADKFEVSLRTIYRDIDAICSAGIPIAAIPGTGGGLEILSKYKIDHNVFSSSELSSILSGLFNVSGIIQKCDMENALAKIRNLMPEKNAESIVVKASQVIIDTNPWFNGGRNLRELRAIEEALSKNKIISFEYLNHSGRMMIRRTEPYQLIFKGQNWYLYAFCLHKNAFRLFKLSRMNRMTITDEVFQVREGVRYEGTVLFPDPMDADVALKTIKLRVHKSIMERVLDFCTWDSFSPCPDVPDEFYVDFPFVENEFNYDLLLGFGPRCQCLEPKEIRAGLKKRIHELSRMYDD